MSEQSPSLQHPEVKENPEGVEPASEATQRDILTKIHELAQEDSVNAGEKRRVHLYHSLYPDSRMDITIYDPGRINHDDYNNKRIATISEVQLNTHDQGTYLSRDYHCVDTPGGWLLVQEWRIGEDVQLYDKAPYETGMDGVRSEYRFEDDQGFPASLSGSELMEIESKALRGYIGSIPGEEYERGLSMVSEEEARSLRELLDEIEDE